MSNYDTIIVPYDFSEHAKAALTTAEDLARRLESNLHLVHVVQLPDFAYGAGPGMAIPPHMDLEVLEKRAMESLSEVVAKVDIPGKVEPHVSQGSDVSERLKETATELGADLIVMGTHGRTGLAHVFLGSIAERTLRGAPCPVLTVRGDEES